MTQRSKPSFFSVRALCFSAVVASLYAALTLMLQPLSFGPVQVRFAEAMTLLPMLFPQAIPGITVGCFISNLIAGSGPWDVALGTLATLLAGIATYALRNKGMWICALPPVLLNGAIVGGMLYYLGFAPGVNIHIVMLSVASGEALACYLLGIPLIRALSKISAEKLHL